MWQYRCRSTKIIDGDTLDLEIDLGFRIVMDIRVRLLGIDTAEIRGPERELGLSAKQFVEDWVKNTIVSDWPLIVETEKTEKYGRWLANINRPDDPVSLVDALKVAGHGK